MRDAEFRKWYDEREGTKSESFAYDVWCAAWEACCKEETPPDAWVADNGWLYKTNIDGACSPLHKGSK